MLALYTVLGDDNIKVLVTLVSVILFLNSGAFYFYECERPLEEHRETIAKNAAEDIKVILHEN